MVDQIKSVPSRHMRCRMTASFRATAIQYEVYEVGKRHGFEPLRAWFQALYETLLGQAQGPRMGSFIALFGRDETVALIEKVLAGERPDVG